jgi:catechol 2,3-dioxygenase-like lactoylglutathione lyase family enzyme
MKTFHIHISVNDLEKNINFYSTVFGEKPTRKEKDYAKWQLTDPPINFAISNKNQKTGLNHLGIQVNSDEELDKIANRLSESGVDSSKQNATSCCYSRSNKYWAVDPTGIPWESFHTLKSIPLYSGENNGNKKSKNTVSCC